MAALSLLGAQLFAQGSATVVGVATDSSGAAAPGVQLTISNVSTGISYRTVSDGAGRYNFSRLPVGDYRLEASAEGFKRVQRSGINLTAEQTLTVDVALEVGAVADSVEVTASVSALETATSTIRTVVRREQITDLPLNGRNALQLQALLPGAVNHTSARASFAQEGGYSVNGARGTDNNFLLDGGQNVDVFTGFATSLPNPDALQEFSVLSSSFSAEYGRGAGSLVTAVTKSGTNQIHGTAYDFLRNDALDARSFFAHRGLVAKQKLRRNQFGASAGGPIRRDKSFLFASWESLRERRSTTRTDLIVPTAAERAGDFSATARRPFDPATANRLPFPNHSIPLTRQSQAARAIVDVLVPLPNFGANQFIYNSPATDDRNQVITRFDHNFTDNDRLYLSYFFNDTIGTQNFTVPLSDGFANWTNNRGLVNYTKVITPALLNTFSYTINHLNFGRGALPILPDKYPGEPGKLAPGFRYDYVGVRTKSATPQFPMNTRLGQVAGYYAITGENYVGFDPHSHEVRNTLTWTRGAHLIKIGGEYAYNVANREASNESDGQTFNWSGLRAGNGYADYLLGLPANFTQQSLLRSGNRYSTTGYFIQDDWKAARTLTLNLGLRWEPNFAISDANNEMVTFQPGQRSTIYPNAPPGLLYPNDPGIPRATIPSDWNNFAPRAGFAWLPFGPNSKTSVRAGYGAFFNTSRGFLLNEAQINQPFVLRIRINDPASFENPWSGFPGGDPFPFRPPTSAEERRAYRFVTPTTIARYFPFDNATPYMQQWNFTLQREIGAGNVVTAAYVGSKGTKLHINYEENQAVFVPGASTTANIDARRPFRDFQSIVAAATAGTSSYHSMQLSFNRRFVKGFFMMANYTWSKSLDLQSVDRNVPLIQDRRNIRADRGPSDFDRRHNFVTSFLASIPMPRKTGPFSRLTQGWQANGIVTVLSGGPLTVIPGNDRALQGGGNQRADVTGDWRLAPGRSFDQQQARYFDTSVFAAAALGQFGNSSRNLVYGPGQYNLDLALFKNTKLTERFNLQFRWELFNALNHANLGDPVVNLISPAFGRINTVTGPRIMQLGMKVIF